MFSVFTFFFLTLNLFNNIQAQLVNFTPVDGSNQINDREIKSFHIKLNSWPTQCDQYASALVELAGTGVLFSVDRNGISSNETGTSVSFTFDGVTAFDVLRTVFVTTPTIYSSASSLPYSIQLKLSCGALTYDIEEYSGIRVPYAGSTPHGWGDPHFKNILGQYFDYHAVGAHTMIDSGSLLIQCYWTPCSWASCTRACAILYGDEVVRFHVNGHNFFVTRGTSKLSKLKVFRNNGNSRYYRVLLNGDETHFVDITANYWGGDPANYYMDIYPYLPAYVSASATGLLAPIPGGLGNLHNVAPTFKRPLAQTLLRCDSDDACRPFFKPLTFFQTKDNFVPTLTLQGFTPLGINQIPNQPMNLIHTTGLKKRSTTDYAPQAIVDEAQKLCQKILESIPECTQILGEDSIKHMIEDCVKDVTFIPKGAFDDLENKKNSLLMRCRANIETSIQSSAMKSLNETLELDSIRISLGFGDNKCANGCLNGGQCSSEGCLCLQGFSGTLCEIPINVNEGIDDCDINGCTCKAGFTGSVCETKI